MIIRCDTYSKTLIKNSMYEATVLMLGKIRTDVILVWLSISIGIVITTKLFLYFITEETGEEYFLKSNRIV